MQRQLIFALLASVQAFAALPATMVWEMRPSVGSNSNGGCFDSAKAGTDYSQQNSAQYSFTDLVITATNTIVSSASHNFAAADVGNCIHISAGSGFTTGWYEITAVGSNDATLDRAAGAGGSTGGTWHEGGAFLDFTNVSGGSQLNVAGNIVWIKNTATLSISSTISISQTSSGYRFVYAGYGSTRGDGVHANVTMTVAGDALFNIQSSNGYEFDWTDFTGPASSTQSAFYAGTANGSNLTIQHSVLSGWKQAINSGENGQFSIFTIYLVDCEIKNSLAYGLNLNFTLLYLFDCYIHNNASGGVFIDQSVSNAAGVIANNSVFANNGSSSGIFTWCNNITWCVLQIDNCVFYDNGLSGTGDGVTVGEFGEAQSGTPAQITNSVFYGNERYGLYFYYASAAPSATYGQSIIQLNDAFGGNGTAARGTNNPAGVGDITLTANPFTNPSSADYSLNSTAGGGSALKQAGIPGVALFGTGYMSVGPLQPMGGSSGGGQVGYPIVQ